MGNEEKTFNEKDFEQEEEEKEERVQKGKKKVLDSQNKFEYKEKKDEPFEKERLKKEEKKIVFWNWVWVILIAAGISFLAYALL